MSNEDPRHPVSAEKTGRDVAHVLRLVGSRGTVGAGCELQEVSDVGVEGRLEHHCPDRGAVALELGCRA